MDDRVTSHEVRAVVATVVPQFRDGSGSGTQSGVQQCPQAEPQAALDFQVESTRFVAIMVVGAHLAVRERSN